MPTKLSELLPDQPFKTVTVRLPEDLHAEIVSLAKEEGRTLKGQLLVMLEHALQASREALEDREAREQ
ncbi:MAG TPA: hypothetical protein VLA19_32510 [Herpetosiphonaceae bacterium]|nr:hypothetical protein [Herpetosiphonaceae bacterium]